MTDEEWQRISEELFADCGKTTQERVDGLMAANIEQTRTTIFEYITGKKTEMV